MPLKYYAAHVNDVSKEKIEELLPGVTVHADGDCGSVWGEHHLAAYPCPHPHVVIDAPTQAMLDVLVEAGVGYVADCDPEWGELVLDEGWTEDESCPYRTVFDADYRTPYGQPSKEDI